MITAIPTITRAQVNLGAIQNNITADDVITPAGGAATPAGEGITINFDNDAGILGIAASGPYELNADIKIFELNAAGNTDATITTSNANGAIEFKGSLTGSGDLLVNGNGVLALYKLNPFSGITTIGSNATVVIKNGSDLSGISYAGANSKLTVERGGSASNINFSNAGGVLTLSGGTASGVTGSGEINFTSSSTLKGVNSFNNLRISAANTFLTFGLGAPSETVATLGGGIIGNDANKNSATIIIDITNVAEKEGIWTVLTGDENLPDLLPGQIRYRGVTKTLNQENIVEGTSF